MHFRLLLCFVLENFVYGLALDPISLSLIHMGQNHGFERALLHPSAYCCVVNTKDFGHLRDGQKILHPSLLLSKKVLCAPHSTFYTSCYSLTYQARALKRATSINFVCTLYNKISI